METYRKIISNISYVVTFGFVRGVIPVAICAFILYIMGLF